MAVPGDPAAARQAAIARLTDALDAALDALRCPNCRGSLRRHDGSVGCDRGHRFDVARQGYVTLTAHPIRRSGDTAGMVAARERIQSAGLLEPVSQGLAAVVPDQARVIVDLGVGTGHHTAMVLQASARATAVGVDTSTYALRRAARAHPRLAAVGADVAKPLPIGDGVADVVMLAFAPRNASEIARILTPSGVVVAVVPRPGHLAELRAPLGLLDVPDQKVAGLEQALDDVGLGVRDVIDTTAQISVTPSQAADLAAMGPTAFHVDRDELDRRAAALPPHVQVTVDVAVVVADQASS